jgi:anaerobic magnesium-protoporphyrin IX monomethyl ester cyclase
MFRAAYNTDFYRAVRDALHAEVDFWHDSKAQNRTKAQIDALWRKVNELEPMSRDEEALPLDSLSTFTSSEIVPVEQLVQLRGV